MEKFVQEISALTGRQTDREREIEREKREEESGEGSQQLLLVDINSKNVRKPSGQNKWRIDRWQEAQSEHN